MTLTESERSVIHALARAALPPGQLMPGADDHTVAKLEEGLGKFPSGIAMGYRAMLWTLQAEALAREGGRFTALPLGRRIRLLEKLEHSEASRLLVRGLLVPLKLAHFDDPRVHQALGCRYAIDPPKRERARWNDQVSDASTVPAGETLECDAVVVGTGAGGGAAALSLAEAGHAVLMLEEGEHFTRSDFTGRPVEMMRKLYRKSGLTVAAGNTMIPIPLGKGVGGTTLINSGTCFRAPESTLRNWQRDLGLEELSVEALAPYYEKVERMLEVAPSTAKALGKPAELIAKGCDALGYSHAPLMRNAPGCDGQGLCCFGCPTDAKRSTNVSYVPAALERGAQLLTGFRVERVLLEGDRAVGVEGITANQTRLQVRAKVVVLSCGSLLTPILLLQNRIANASGQVGRNLSIHPASSANAFFEEPTNAWNAVPQGYAIDEFHDEGILFEGAHTPLDITGASITAFGPRYIAAMEQYNHCVGFGFMVKDTSRGRVTAGRNGEPRIRYWLNDDDVKRMRRAFGLLARVFFAAGAKEVWPTVAGFERLQSLSDVERLERANISARHIDITAYHPLGTCRMGPDPASSVVGPSGEAHDVVNLWICDGSALPSSLGVNPQMTIMAMSLRASGFIDRRLRALA